MLQSLLDLDPARFDRPDILKAVAKAARSLAELKGVAETIPNEGILLNTLSIQEAKDSSAIENIITTHDEVFQGGRSEAAGPAAKEVENYRAALRVGFEDVLSSRLLTVNQILTIQRTLEGNDAGFRTQAGTKLLASDGRTVYTPPQDPAEIVRLMGALERFINDDALLDADPLVKMALMHHQFESIHPFYDGNGRTGRILNVLYLVKQGLLRVPVLYMSRHIVSAKDEYYRLLQAVRDEQAWEAWVLYMMEAVQQSALDGIDKVRCIKELLLEVKHRMREQHRFYSQDLVNNIFSHPYTKIDFVMQDLRVSRLTATNYLDALVDTGFLTKRRMGRSNFYINAPLFLILSGEQPPAGDGE
jgi:Fic family protein